MVATERSVPSMVAYATLSAPLSMLMLQLIVYLPPFYAAEMGVNIAQVGLIFFAARAWDAVIDPLIGNLSDQTRTRWGRRKPWIVIGTPLLMLLTWMFAQPPENVGVGYLLVTAFLFYISLTVVQVPYMSWGAEISRNYEGRTRVGAYREGGLMAGILLAVAMPLAIFATGEPTLREILFVFALAVIILLPITAWLATRYSPAGAFVDTGRKGLVEALSLLRKNAPLKRVLTGVFFLWLGGSMFNALVLFVVERSLGLGTGDFLWFVFVQYSLSVLLLPFSVHVGNRIGRHRALVLGGFGFLALLPLLSIVPTGNFWAAMSVFVVLGLISNFIWIMPPAIVADTVDYGMFKGAGDDSAIYMALYLFTQKIALAAGVGIALPLSAALGFNPMEASGPEAVSALHVVALFLPCLIGSVGALTLYNYPIDARRHHVIRRWLARRGEHVQ